MAVQFDFATDGMTIVNVPEWRVDAFEKKVQSINKKAVKLGLETLNVVLTGIDPMEVKSGSKISKFNVHNYLVITPIPKVNGWSLAGIYKDTDGDGVLKVTEIQKSDFNYESIDMKVCNHCNTRRLRKSGYVLMNDESKEVMQLGSACVLDFLGTTDPKIFEKWYGLYTTNWPKYDPVNPGVPYYFAGHPIIDILACTLDEVEHYGYVSKNVSDNTGKEATVTLVAQQVYSGKYTFTNAHVEKAKEIIEWFNVYAERGYDKTNTYLLNVVNIITKKEVTSEIALCASAVAMYHRETAEKKDRSHGEFVGNIKERTTVAATLERVHSNANDYYAQYLYYVYFMRDGDGNQLAIKSSRQLDMEMNKEYKLTGTVTGHNSHPKFGKTTWLNRVKMEK